MVGISGKKENRPLLTVAFFASFTFLTETLVGKKSKKRWHWKSFIKSTGRWKISPCCQSTDLLALLLVNSGPSACLSCLVGYEITRGLSHKNTVQGCWLMPLYYVRFCALLVQVCKDVSVRETYIGTQKTGRVSVVVGDILDCLWPFNRV